MESPLSDDNTVRALRGKEDPGQYRVPPHNYEAEQALLGAILANNRAFERVSEFLRPDHFADALLGRIYEACGKLIERGQLADVLTLQAPVRERFGTAGSRRRPAPGAAGRLGGDGNQRRGLRPHHPRQPPAPRAHRRRPERGQRGLCPRRRQPGHAADRGRGAKALRPGDDGPSGGRLRKPGPGHGQGPWKWPNRHSRKTATSAASPPGCATSTPGSAGCSRRTWWWLAGRPGMGKTALATNIAFDAATPPRPAAAARAPWSDSFRWRCRPSNWSRASWRSAPRCRRTRSAAAPSATTSSSRYSSPARKSRACAASSTTRRR